MPNNKDYIEEVATRMPLKDVILLDDQQPTIEVDWLFMRMVISRLNTLKHLHPGHIAEADIPRAKGYISNMLKKCYNQRMENTVLRNAEGDRFVFFCEGCGCEHYFNKSWEFNGDYMKPTVNPSILVTGVDVNGKDMRCHSFIKDGEIQFLSDCTHSKTGQTIKLNVF